VTGTEPRDRVLVINDNPGIRALLTSALTTAGYHVDADRARPVSCYAHTVQIAAHPSPSGSTTRQSQSRVEV
jgi:hypothetical protein